MGSHNQWYVDCNLPNGHAVLEKVKDAFETWCENDGGWCNFCFRKNSPRTKWWPDDDVSKVSKMFPGVIFSIACSGESGSFKTFVMNGYAIDENEVFPKPRFPSLAKMRQAVRLNKAKTKATKLAAK